MKNKLLSDEENRVLNKFKRMNVTSGADEYTLNKYASVGFVRFGFDWDKMKQTAILTVSGLKHLNR